MQFRNCVFFKSAHLEILMDKRFHAYLANSASAKNQVFVRKYAAKPGKDLVPPSSKCSPTLPGAFLSCLGKKGSKEADRGGAERWPAPAPEPPSPDPSRRALGKRWYTLSPPNGCGARIGTQHPNHCPALSPPFFREARRNQRTFLSHRHWLSLC